MEIAAGIHRIEAPLGDRYVALYLLVGERASMLVDTGVTDSMTQVAVPYAAQLGLDPDRLRYLVCTHSDFDHLGGNQAALDAFPQALLVCHVLDRPMVEDLDALITHRYGEFLAEHGYDDTDEDAKAYIRQVSAPAPVDLAVTGGERVRLSPDWDVELIHTPGHSWGSLSVWDPRSRTMIAGDAVLGDGLMTRDGRPAFPPTYRYVQTYRATIDRLGNLPIATLATAHYPLYRGAQVAEFLALSRSYTDNVESAILQVLTDSPNGATALQIIDRGRRGLGPWPEPAAQSLMYPIIGHLEWLTEYGAVRPVTGTPVRWQLAR